MRLIAILFCFVLSSIACDPAGDYIQSSQIDGDVYPILVSRVINYGPDRPTYLAAADSELDIDASKITLTCPCYLKALVRQDEGGIAQSLSAQLDSDTITIKLVSGAHYEYEFKDYKASFLVPQNNPE